MLKLTKVWVLGAAMALPLLLSVPVQAQNILANPNFSGSEYSAPPWVFTPAAQGSDFNYFYGGADFAGTDAKYDDTISQTVTTVPGQTYHLSFDLNTFYPIDQNFFVSWDGSVIPGAGEQDAGQNGNFDFNVVGTGTDTLSFAGNNVPSANLLSDLSLVEGAGTFVPFAIPEIDPASAAAPVALCMGLFLLADLRRKSS